MKICNFFSGIRPPEPQFVEWSKPLLKAKPEQNLTPLSLSSFLSYHDKEKNLKENLLKKMTESAFNLEDSFKDEFVDWCRNESIGESLSDSAFIDKYFPIENTPEENFLKLVEYWIADDEKIKFSVLLNT